MPMMLRYKYTLLVVKKAIIHVGYLPSAMTVLRQREMLLIRIHG